MANKSHSIYKLSLIFALLVVAVSIAVELLVTNQPYQLNTVSYSGDQIIKLDEKIQLAFDPIEEAIASIEVNPDNSLEIEPGLESAFRGATEPFIDAPPNPETLNRIRFLIEKSLPHPAGQQFADLFPIFFNYLTEESKLLKKEAEKSIEHELQINEQLIVLRQEHFGVDLTRRLYGAQHLLARYLLERQRIQQDTSISEEERTALTEKTQEEFNRAMAEYNE